MKIRDVMNAKEAQTVVTVPPGTSLTEAAKVLAEHKIGTVVVSANGTSVEGILSERDIVRRIAAEGVSAMARMVEEVMTARVVTAHPDEPLDAALTTMTDGRFRHMPVVEDGVAVGLISIGDAVKAQLGQLSFERAQLEGMIMGR